MARWVEWARGLLARAQATLPGRVVQRYADDHMSNWAAAIAYHAFFSLFPLLLSLLTLVGLVVRDPARLAQIASGIVQLFPREAADPILVVLQGTREHVGLLGLISVAGLVYGAAALFGTLEEAFDVLYRCPTRDFLRQKLMAIGMLLLFALLLLLSILAAGVRELLTSLRALVGPPWTPWGDWLGHVQEVAHLVVQALSIGWAFLLFLLVYWIVPNRRLRPWQVWPGALAAAVLFRLSTELFPLYLEHFGQFNRYGTAFALAFLLLTWFFFLAHILLIGATLNAVLEDGRASGRPTRASRESPGGPTRFGAADAPPPDRT
jgi:membrane protein